MSWKNRIFAEKVKRHKNSIMKFIHTADWHIGQNLKHFSRTEEHKHFFRQLTEIVKEEMPDALLVSGDVFHTSTPDSEAIRLYTDALVGLHNSKPDMRIVIIAGNHDSPSRLDANASIFRLANVSVIGAVTPDLPERHIVELPNIGYVIAVPHHYLRAVDGVPHIFSTTQGIVEKLNTDNLPVVMMAHMYINGADITGHDTGNVGGMQAADITTLGTGFDYLALGHIHRPQNISANTRYSGSPLHVSFAERYPHSVTIVNIDKHGCAPQITERRINQLMHLYHVPDNGALPFDEAIEALRNFNPEEQGYVMLHVKTRNYLPTDAQARVEELMGEKTNLKFADFAVEFEAEQGKQMTTVLTTSQLQQMTPIEVAKTYYRETTGEEMPKRMISMVEEIEKMDDER